MIDLVLYDKSPDETMTIVRNLRSHGWQQGKDFDFKYSPSKWDDFSGTPIVRKHTMFSFYNEKLATFFTLKYL